MFIASLLPLIALYGVSASPIIASTSRSLTSPISVGQTPVRRADPATLDKSIFFSPEGPRCEDMAMRLQDGPLIAALCAVVKLNPNWLRKLVNGGSAPNGQGEVTITVWKDQQNDIEKWFDQILEKSEQTVKFEELGGMQSTWGDYGIEAGLPASGAKSATTGWWPAAFEKAVLQAGFIELEEDHQYRSMYSHRGLSAVTGFPSWVHEYNRMTTADADKPALDDMIWDILEKADWTPVLLFTDDRPQKTLETRAVYTVMTTGTDAQGQRMVTYFDPVAGETRTSLFADIQNDFGQVGVLRDYPALIV